MPVGNKANRYAVMHKWLSTQCPTIIGQFHGKEHLRATTNQSGYRNGRKLSLAEGVEREGRAVEGTEVGRRVGACFVLSHF